MTALGAALDKLGLHLVQNVLELFAHGFSQNVGLTLRESGQFLGKQHDLLLVDRNTVGFLQVFLHVRQVVGNGFHAMLASNE